MSEPKLPPPVDHEAYLQAIVASATVAIITVDETQNIVLFNQAAESVFGCSAAEVIGKSLERFIPAHARAHHHSHIANFTGAGQGSARAMGGDRILRGVRADGSEFPIDASISVTQVDGRKLYTVFLRDVTERVRERDKLRYLSDIVESSSEAILSRRADGTIVSWNQAAARIFGYASEEMVGRNISMLYPHDVPEGHIDLAERAFNGETIVNFQTRRRRKDGVEIDVEVTISPIKSHDGSVVGASAIYSDISERKRLEAELHARINDQRRVEGELRESRDRLRELSSALQSIREDEKTRIARELHDELGQMLAALKMDATVIAGGLDPAQEDLLKRTSAMRQLIDTTVISVRRIAADLRPVMLDNLGLAPTLEWLTREFTARSGIHVDLEIPDEELGVTGDSATAIFRIVQEALTNVARHSGADEVFIEVLRREGQVTVRVRDNGKGFNEPDARKSRSFGLLGMRERAHVLGGELKVSHVAHGGTVIEAVIPMFGTTDGKSR